jgi:hypothetical protein
MTRKTPTGKQLRAELRRARVIEGIAHGDTVAEIAQQQGVHPKTITRDKQALMTTLRHTNAENVEAYRQEQLDELSLWRDTLSSSKIKDDRKVELALAILDRQIKLLGTAAPSKSMSLNLHGALVAPEGTPVSQMTDEQLMYAAASAIYEGHTDEQIQQIKDFANSLPRQTREQEIECEMARGKALLDSILQPEPEPAQPVELILDPTVNEEEKIQ